MAGPQQQKFAQPYAQQHQQAPMKTTNKMMMQTADLPAMVPPPSFPPQPTPRKINNATTANPHTPTMYQNVPSNSKAYSDPRPLAARLETATPNRFSERFDSDRSADSQLSSDPYFRRSASARLPKQKHERDRGNGMDYTAAMQEESDASKSNSEQVHNDLDESIHIFFCGPA
jgi:hypothetical protein